MRTHFSALLILAAVYSAQGQDTRTVTEPKIPPSCTVLTARLASVNTAIGSTLADSDEGKPDTLRIQQAMDHCKAGQAVELKPGEDKDAFLAGPLELRRGVTLLVDKGVILFGSRNPRDYDVAPGLCGTVTEKKYPYTQGISGHACKPLIGGKDVADAAVMGDGIIDGRRGFKLLGQENTWEDLAEQSIMGWPQEYTRWARGVGKVPVAMTAPPKVVGLQNNPRMIILAHCDNFTLYRIQLRNSPNFAVSYAGGNGFTVWGVVINSAKDALNGDGINLGQPWPEVATPTTNVTITHSYIYAGDDNLAVKSRTGSPTTNVSVIHNHFYAGHGIGTGSSTSGGISHVRVSDLTLDGTSTGINMKSNDKLGGLVKDVEFMRRRTSPQAPGRRPPPATSGRPGRAGGHRLPDPSCSARDVGLDHNAEVALAGPPVVEAAGPPCREAPCPDRPAGRSRPATTAASSGSRSGRDRTRREALHSGRTPPRRARTRTRASWM